MTKTSELTSEEFHYLLEKHVQEGNPWLNGTPFALFKLFQNTSKPFLGEYTDNKFTLSSNGTFEILPYVIEGSFHWDKQKQVSVINYQIKRIAFGYWWIRLMFPIALLAISILLYQTAPEAHRMSIIYLMWIVLVIPWIFILWLSIRSKLNFEQTFIDCFGLPKA